MKAEELQEIFSTNLKRQRIRSSLSQMKLAEKANLSVGYICDLESGRRWGTPETFSKLAQALNIHPFELLLPLESSENSEENFYREKHLTDFTAFLRENLTNTINKSLSDSLKDFL